MTRMYNNRVILMGKAHLRSNLYTLYCGRGSTNSFIELQTLFNDNLCVITGAQHSKKL